MPASLIGRKIGKYQVVAELGRGQHSVVYKAWQQALERHIALKVLRHYDQQTLRKFQAEAILTAKLIERGATNIRQMYEVGQTRDGYLFVAMEYVEDSLRSFLQRARPHRQPINPTAVAKLLMPVAQALDAIHSMGYVHLDVKPQNILISRSGRAMLADFGIAQQRGMRTHACTPTYASPEQADGDRPVGPWSDIYSLGVVLYEVIAGQPPFRGDLDIVILNKHLTEKPPSPREANPRLTVGQERALLKALAKSPRERPGSATELLDAVLRPGNLLSGVIERPSDVLRTTSNWFRRLSRPALVGGLLLAILAVVLLLGALLVPLLWPRWPWGAAAATQTAVATALTPPPTQTPSVTPTPSPRPTYTSTPTPPPTSTLAPTPTRTPTRRPRPTSTRQPTPQPTPSPNPAARWRLPDHKPVSICCVSLRPVVSVCATL